MSSIYSAAADVICGGFPCQDISLAGRRDRVWIVANASGDRRDFTSEGSDRNERDALAPIGSLREPRIRPEGSADAADATSIGRRTRGPWGSPSVSERLCDAASSLAYANGKPTIGPAISWPERDPWGAEPTMDRVVDGISYRMVESEISALGNAVVPQIPEIIGRAIMSQRA
jgi:DNA (cytosine-5)-methyltransferase 1